MGLITPRLKVTMEDGICHEVQTVNFDLVMWDKERAARRWPTMEDAPVLSGTFLAWHALTRTGAIGGMSFDEFCRTAIEVQPTDDESEVDPTRPGADPG